MRRRPTEAISFSSSGGAAKRSKPTELPLKKKWEAYIFYKPRYTSYSMLTASLGLLLKKTNKQKNNTKKIDYKNK